MTSDPAILVNTLMARRGALSAPRTFDNAISSDIEGEGGIALVFDFVSGTILAKAVAPQPSLHRAPQLEHACWSRVA